MRYLRLLGLFARTELQFELAYRVNFAIDVLSLVMVIATSVGAVLILFAYTPALGGWTLPQMLVLLGVFYIVQGVSELVFIPSFERFMEHVRLGTLDFILIKPTNSQFMISTRYVQVPQLGQAAMGLVLVGVGVVQIGERIGLAEVASFVVTLTCGLFLVYGLLLVLSTLSFWFVRVENLLAIFWSFLDAGRFPVDVYPGWLRITLSTVVPIGIAVTVPAQAIAGRLDLLGFVAFVVGTIVVCWFASWFWRVGLRSYTGASA